MNGPLTAMGSDKVSKIYRSTLTGKAKWVTGILKFRKVHCSSIKRRKVFGVGAGITSPIFPSAAPVANETSLKLLEKSICHFAHEF